MVPLPGRAMPIASDRQFMLLAVNIPEQLPQVGQAAYSISSSSASVMLAVGLLPTRHESVDEVDRLAAGRSPRLHRPAGDEHGGMSTRIAPMNMPGTILSQLGMQIMPSNMCAWIIVSTLSAMSSRGQQ